MPSRLLAGTLVLVALLLGACAGAPTQEMTDARLAVGAAREAGAEHHATIVYGRAVAHLEAAAASLQSGAYEPAKREAVAARLAAIDARRIASAVSRAESAIAEAVPGTASRDAERLLEDARSAAGRGDVPGAVDLAERAARRASTAR